MVTVVDPTGTPNPIYTRSGLTIQTVTAGVLTNTNDPTQYSSVTSECGHTIIIAQGSATNLSGILLPTGVDTGDVIEVYAEIGNVLAAPGMGESYGDNVPTPSSAQGGWNSVSVTPNNGVQFRKTSSSNWKVMG